MTAPRDRGDARSPARERLLSIDALRGLAVFLMMEQHMGVWLWNGGGGRSLAKVPALVAFNALGGAAAPLFVTLAGVGTSLLVAKRTGQGRGGLTLDLVLLRRGIVIALCGLLLNVLTPSWFSLGSWFVLHVMGFAIACAPLWRRLSGAALLALALATLAATVAVQNALEIPPVYSNRFMADATRPGGALRLALAEGQFPIFPWLAMYLSGLVVGRWILAGRRDRIWKLALGTFSLGAALVTAYALGRNGVLPELAVDPWLRAVRIRLGFYPAHPPIILLLHTVVLVLIGLGLALERRVALSEGNLMVCLGRASLTLLIVHVVVFRELFRWPHEGFWRFMDPWPPMNLWNALSANAALAVIFGWTIASALAARLWQRHGYRFGAEWALRKLGG